jgi:hypothetical protein
MGNSNSLVPRPSSFVLRRAITALLLLWLAGCGYSATRLLPAEYQVIYIEPFQNAIPITTEMSERTGFIANIPGLEEEVNQGLINRFLFDGNLRVTSDPERADLILSGRMYDFYRQALRQADNDVVEEYRLNLTATIALRDTRKDELILEEPSLIADTTYTVVGVGAKSESAAVDELVIDFSRRVVEWVIEYW